MLDEMSQKNDSYFGRIGSEKRDCVTRLNFHSDFKFVLLMLFHNDTDTHDEY